MKPLLEVCVVSVESAKTAEAVEAQRVELCDNLWEGGTTPSIGMISNVRKAIDIGIYVLIRPRGGDFIYSDAEFDVMKDDIIAAKKAGADGIVSGVLYPDGTVDVDRTSELVELAKPLPFTFHRAFDCVNDPVKGLNDVISTGASRVLTSGLASKAVDGIDTLANLQDTYGHEIEILVGGGITSENIAQIASETNCREFHLTGKKWQKSSIQYLPAVKMNGLQELPENDYLAASEEELKKVRLILDTL